MRRNEVVNAFRRVPGKTPLKGLTTTEEDRFHLTALRWALSLLLLILCPAFVFAAPPIEVRVQASPREVYMGDPIRYDVSIEHSDNIDVLEQWPVEKMGAFEILDSTPSVKSEIDAGRQRLTKSYSLIVFATGEQSIPPFKVQYRNDSDNVESIESAPITISVASLVGSGTTEIRDIKQPVEIPVKIGPWVYWLLGIVLLIILIFLLIVFWKRPVPEILEPVEPPIPADIWALQQLRIVRQGPALRDRNAKQLALSTSEIIRRYLDKRFGFNTIDLTTEEILQLLQKSPIENEIRSSFGDFFSLTDLIKFAKYQPEESALIDVVDNAEDLVKKTRPMHEMAEPEEAES